MDIDELVTEYVTGELTWHDIQDIVEAYVLRKNEGTELWWYENVQEVNEILEKIDNAIKFEKS